MKNLESPAVRSGTWDQIFAGSSSKLASKEVHQDRADVAQKDPVPTFQPISMKGQEQVTSGQ